MTIYHITIETELGDVFVTDINTNRIKGDGSKRRHSIVLAVKDILGENACFLFDSRRKNDLVSTTFYGCVAFIGEGGAIGGDQKATAEVIEIHPLASFIAKVEKALYGNLKPMEQQLIKNYYHRLRRNA